MAEIILPKLEKIRVVPMSITRGRIEVYACTNKFTGKEEEAFLPELKPFGSPFMRYSLETESFALDSAREAEERLEQYVRRAFYQESVSFESDDELTLGITCGARWNIGAEPTFRGEGNIKAKERYPYPLQLIPSQFYKIIRKITDLRV